MGDGARCCGDSARLMEGHHAFDAAREQRSLIRLPGIEHAAGNHAVEVSVELEIHRGNVAGFNCMGEAEIAALFGSGA